MGGAQLRKVEKTNRPEKEVEKDIAGNFGGDHWGRCKVWPEGEDQSKDRRGHCSSPAKTVTKLGCSGRREIRVSGNNPKLSVKNTPPPCCLRGEK